MYDGEVWYTDRQIGRLVDFVAHQPWGNKTAIILTSDHGEAFAEHRMIRHGVELWEELVRVPLVIYVPGIPPHRVTQRRSAIDLVPTLLDLFEREPPTGTGASGSGSFDFVSGHSLSDDIVLPPGYQSEARDVLIDMPAGPNNDERRAFIHDGRKLTIFNAVRFLLFDLSVIQRKTRSLRRSRARGGHAAHVPGLQIAAPRGRGPPRPQVSRALDALSAARRAPRFLARFVR